HLGSAEDPWRTAQARHRYRTDYGSEIHGEEATSSIPGPEDLSSQPCRCDRIDGSVRGADSFRLLYGLLIFAAFSMEASMAGRHYASERPMDRPPGDRSLRLVRSATLRRL